MGFSNALDRQETSLPIKYEIGYYFFQSVVFSFPFTGKKEVKGGNLNFPSLK